MVVATIALISKTQQYVNVAENQSFLLLEFSKMHLNEETNSIHLTNAILIYAYSIFLNLNKCTKK